MDFKNDTVSPNFLDRDSQLLLKTYSWSVYYVMFWNAHQDNFVCPARSCGQEKMSEPVISGVASQKFPFWIRSRSLGGLRPGRRKKDYASRAHTKAPNSRTLRSISFCVAARETGTKKINDIPIRLPPISWLVALWRTRWICVRYRPICYASCWVAIRFVCVYIREHFFVRPARPWVVLCILGHPQDENIGMVAAGASEQQEQHELEEESGFVSTEVRKRGERRGGEQRRKKGRTDERWKKKIDEEIPSRRVLTMCDPV